MAQRTVIETRGGAGRLDAAAVLEFAELLATEPTAELDDAERIDLLHALERVKCAAEGAQAVVSAQFDRSQRAQAASRGVPKERRGRGIAHQIALARRVSPHRGQRLLGLAKVLVAEMPCTLAALRGGYITEWQATLVARETACLSLDDRRWIDRRLCGVPEDVEATSPRELAGRAAKLAAELDPESVYVRRSKAEADRTVTVRPAPDTMSWVTGHLPVKAGVAVYAALRAEADRLVGAGDGRTRGQIMADTLVSRVLGGASGSPQVPVLVNVVIGVDSLLATDDAGTEIPGYGPIPAHAVRDWIRRGLDGGAEVELRRLFADPRTGQLVAGESKAGAFPKPLAELIALRDLRCRNSWCDAPVRHVDHVVARAEGGPTSLDNGQGLCEGCNYAKEAIGWRARPRPAPGHQVETTTPTGHTYRSRAPELVDLRSPGERWLARVLRVA